MPPESNDNDYKISDALQGAIRTHDELYNYLNYIDRWKQVVQIIAFLYVGIVVPMFVSMSPEFGGFVSLSELNFINILILSSPVIFIVTSFSSVAFVLDYRQTVETVLNLEETVLNKREGIIEPIIFSQTRRYKFIVFLQFQYILGTFLSTALWFITSHGSLEPLSLIYGFGTAVFVYYQSSRHIMNPLAYMIDTFTTISKTTDTTDIS